MLLVQQAHHPAALSSLMPSLKHISPTHHRRNPSAPAVVQVQPSKTPGLLNLAPSRTFHPRYSTPRQHRTPKAQLQQPTTAPASAPHVEKERSRGRGTSDKEKVTKPARSVHLSFFLLFLARRECGLTLGGIWQAYIEFETWTWRQGTPAVPLPSYFFRANYYFNRRISLNCCI